MTHLLRLVEPRDLPELVQLCREHAEYERASWPERERVAGLASLMFDRDDIRGWVLEGAHELMGFASAMLERSTWDAGQYLHLDCLYLRPAYRGQGHGRAMFSEVARAALEMGALNLQWQTPSWNESAVRFYDRLGASHKEKLRYTLTVEQCAALVETPVVNT